MTMGSVSWIEKEGDCVVKDRVQLFGQINPSFSLEEICD